MNLDHDFSSQRQEILAKKAGIVMLKKMTLVENLVHKLT
jgi:hypothetical protein